MSDQHIPFERFSSKAPHEEITEAEYVKARAYMEEFLEFDPDILENFEQTWSQIEPVSNALRTFIIKKGPHQQKAPPTHPSSATPLPQLLEYVYTIKGLSEENWVSASTWSGDNRVAITLTDPQPAVDGKHYIKFMVTTYANTKLSDVSWKRGPKTIMSDIRGFEPAYYRDDPAQQQGYTKQLQQGVKELLRVTPASPLE